MNFILIHNSGARHHVIEMLIDTSIIAIAISIINIMMGFICMEYL